MIIVTPSLMVGEESDTIWFDDTVYVEVFDQAVKVIDDGGIALIPDDAVWQDKARDVLRHYGCSDEWIESVIRFATTGRT